MTRSFAKPQAHVVSRTHRSVKPERCPWFDVPGGAFEHREQVERDCVHSLVRTSLERKSYKSWCWDRGVGRFDSCH